MKNEKRIAVSTSERSKSAGKDEKMKSKEKNRRDEFSFRIFFSSYPPPFNAIFP